MTCALSLAFKRGCINNQTKSFWLLPSFQFQTYSASLPTAASTILFPCLTRDWQRLSSFFFLARNYLPITKINFQTRCMETGKLLLATTVPAINPLESILLKSKICCTMTHICKITFNLFILKDLQQMSKWQTNPPLCHFGKNVTLPQTACQCHFDPPYSPPGIGQ